MAFGLGESIGTAYVRIVADGTGLDASIREQMDDAVSDAHLDSAGERAGSDFREGFDKDLEKRLGKGPGVKRAIENFNVSIAKSIKAQQYFETPNWYAFKNLAKKEFGDLGEVAAAEMERSFIAKGSLDGIEHEQENFYKRVNQLHVEQVKAADKLTQEEFDNYARARAAELKIEENMDRAAQMFRRREAARVREEERERRKRTTSAGRFATQMDEFAEKISGAFGKGSRNDFLNIFGSFVGFIPRAISGVAKLGEKLQAFGTEAAEIFTKAGGGMKGLGAVIEASGPAIAGGITAAAAAVIALEIAASTASLAAGGLTAVLGTVGSGLIGAVGVLAGAMLPLAAGIGAVVIGWQAMSDAQRKAFNLDLTPLTNAFSGLGRIASTDIFEGLGTSLSRLTPFIESLAGPLHQVTQAVREQIDSWVDLARSGGFDSFVSTMGTDLPGQIANLNGAFQNLFTSLTGWFQGLSPVTSRFLADLNAITGKFSDWINSAKGQDEITDTFNKAYDALKSLGRTLVSGSRLLKNFFEIGSQYGGNDLFDSLADQFQRWSDYLTDPANQESISRWVKDGAEFVKILGDIVVAVGKFIAAIDTPFMRTVINVTLATTAASFKILAGAIELCWKALSILKPFLQPIAQGLENLRNPTDAAKGGLEGMADAADKFSIGISPLGTALRIVGSRLGEAKDKTDEARKSFLSVDNPAFVGFRQGRAAIEATAEASAEAAEKIQKTRTALKQQREEARNTVQGWTGLTDAVHKASVTLDGWIRKMAQQARALEQFTANARAAAKKGLDEGLIKSLAQAGPEGAFRMQQLADATRTELGKANDAWQRNQQAMQDWAKFEVPPKKITVETTEAEKDVEALQTLIYGVKDKDVTITTNLVTRRKTVLDGLIYGPKTASGGVFSGPTTRLIGEAGAEAVVPLNRSLSQVDPAVRELSAFAQGLPSPGGGASTSGPQKVLNIGPITVSTPTGDPHAVAVETVNRLALVGGF